MKIPAPHTDTSALGTAAAQCVQLLRAGHFAALAQSFGYAVALGREPASAIAADLATSLREVGASALVGNSEPQVTVKYFEPNESLLAVIECELLTNNDSPLLVELAVTAPEGQTHVTLEQISSAALYLPNDRPDASSK